METKPTREQPTFDEAKAAAELLLKYFEDFETKAEPIYNYLPNYAEFIARYFKYAKPF